MRDARLPLNLLGVLGGVEDLAVHVGVGGQHQGRLPGVDPLQPRQVDEVVEVRVVHEELVDEVLVLLGGHDDGDAAVHGLQELRPTLAVGLFVRGLVRALSREGGSRRQGQKLKRRSHGQFLRAKSASISTQVSGSRTTASGSRSMEIVNRLVMSFTCTTSMWGSVSPAK